MHEDYDDSYLKKLANEYKKRYRCAGSEETRELQHKTVEINNDQTEARMRTLQYERDVKSEETLNIHNSQIIKRTLVVAEYQY